MPKTDETKEDNKEKCPISGAENCDKCTPRQVEKCSGVWNGEES